jgi:signal transduction histidine kinase
VVEITRGIRNLAHLGAGSPQVVDLADEIENALRVVSIGSGEDLVIERQLAPVPAVHGHSVLVSQIFLNIIVNAVDACEGSGKIVIKTMEEDGHSVATIEDSGPGMPPEVLQHIFDPFYTTKEVGKGTGLGLYTVYQIIEKMGAQVHVESRVGVGTTFRIVFPRIGEAAVQEEQHVGAR